MPAETSIVRIDRPFTGGLADDPRDPRQAAVLQDALYPLMVTCERGPFAYTGEEDPVGFGNLLTDVAELVVTAGGLTDPDLIVGGSNVLAVATSPARSGEIDANFSYLNAVEYRVMKGLFNGEVLFFPQDGESPILRWGGSLAAFDLFASGTSFDKTEDFVSLASVTLDSTYVGAFVTAFGFHGSRRIVNVLSATAVQIDEPFAESKNVDTNGGVVSPLGVFGLLTEVTTRGKASLTSAGNTITGDNTLWSSSGPNDGAPRFLDFIAPVDGNDYGEALTVDDVVSDTSIEVSVALAPAFGASAVDYVIGRPLVGKWGFVHKDRLYTGGIAWAPRRMQVSPPLWSGSDPRNGEFSYDVEIGRASLSAYQEVPHPEAPGELVGGLSLPSGNGLVASTTDVHVFWGEYPAMSFEKVGSFGILSQEGLLVADDGAWIAGPSGVYEMRGNRPESITEGRIQQRYEAVARDASAIVLGFHDGHLLVAVHSGADSTVFVWDTATRTWTGTWTLPRPTGMHASRVPGEAPRLLAAMGDRDQIVDLSGCFVTHEDTITPSDDDVPSFRARTGDQVLGDLSREREVKYAKIAWEMEAAAPAEVDVSAGEEIPAFPTNPAATLGPTDGREEAYLEPYTSMSGTPPSGFGERTRAWSLDIFHNAASTHDVERLAIHELEFLVKEYSLRG